MQSPELGNGLVVRRQPPPAATSTRCCADTQTPAVARNGFVGDNRTDRASADHADRSQAVRCRLPRRVQIPNPPCPADPRTHRSPGTHDRPESVLPNIPETACLASAPSPCTYPIKKCPRFRKGIFSLLFPYSIEFRNRL